MLSDQKQAWGCLPVHVLCVLVLILTACLGGCGKPALRIGDVEFVEFMPVVMEEHGDELQEAPSLLGDAEFRMGLVITLNGYGHKFFCAEDRVFVPKTLGVAGERANHERNAREYRWNLTTKARMNAAMYEKWRRDVVRDE